MFPDGLSGTPMHSEVHLVDPSNPECFASIGAAIACAKPREYKHRHTHGLPPAPHREWF